MSTCYLKSEKIRKMVENICAHYTLNFKETETGVLVSNSAKESIKMGHQLEKSYTRIIKKIYKKVLLIRKNSREKISLILFMPKSYWIFKGIE